ncbi:4Fe-4S binding protein [Methanotorris formicicus]|uniref:Polyferredoxin n=1 Tax=Methanotorris formicicus Mc-S-70 TaxID=647171 RepID=H1L0Q5_9EURY|nr:4Fe-4S dicluster domain-containing protein [Methanotorris formicicus]EHP84522.1 polyferredoxin [Methanotorris formicicus Mc-S-70]
MSSSIWYLYEFAKKKWLKKFFDAKTEKESTIPPKRYRKVPPIVQYPEKCISCTACKESCPSSAIEMDYDKEFKKEIPKIDDGSCIGCGNCVESCPTGVLEIDSLREETDGLPFDIPKYTNLIIDEELCVRCNLCKENCPVETIHYEGGKYKIHLHDCIACKRCVEVCPVDAIREFTEKELTEKIDKAQKIKFKILAGEIKIEENKIDKIPYIVESLCINCYNCVDVCVGKIDIKNHKVVECVKCGLCLEVCPTKAMRLEKLEPKPKRTDVCYMVDESKCIGCRICYNVCNVGAIQIGDETKLPYINPLKCAREGVCARECPVNAISLVDTEKALMKYKLTAICDELRKVMRKDLEEYSKRYVLAKSELEKITKNEIKKLFRK